MTIELKDMKSVYQITRKPQGYRGQNQHFSMKARDGTMVTEKNVKLEKVRITFSADVEPTRTYRPLVTSQRCLKT